MRETTAAAARIAQPRRGAHHFKVKGAEGVAADDALRLGEQQKMHHCEDVDDVLEHLRCASAPRTHGDDCTAATFSTIRLEWLSTL
jgi:hypothetical protein